MPLQLYTSNRLEALARRLADVLSTPPGRVFEPECIVVQSKGMQRWLSLQIAGYSGICANVEFPFPKAFVSRMFSRLTGASEEMPFAPPIMTWRIMKLLPQIIDHKDGAPLKHYLAGDAGDVKLYQLSEKTASVLDDYLVYRPDIITAWERGESTASAGEHERWQSRLWRLLVEDTRQTGADPLHHAAIKQRFVEALQNPEALRQLPERVSVFGIPALPPYYLEVLLALAEHIPVYLFYLNPCSEYWQFAYPEKKIIKQQPEPGPEHDLHLETGNSLLASLGESGREFFTLVMSAVGDTGEQLFEDPGRTTLLAQVQSDILRMRNPAQEGIGPRTINSDDRSVRVYSCHTPMREVEVLHDTLLYLFETCPELRPNDIAVMMPDIHTYAPLVQAVFDTPEQSHARIPYTIADRALKNTSTVADAFLKILTLDRERFRATAVLDILETAAVRKKYGLSETDLPLIAGWVEKTGIRWGADADYKQSLGLPSFHENTWRFGLERMILGHALPEADPPQVFSGVLPYGDIEAESALVLGRFAAFVDDMIDIAQRAAESRSPAGWQDFLTDVLSRVFTDDSATEQETGRIRAALEQNGFAGSARAAGFSDPISSDVMLTRLSRCFEDSAAPRGFISSGVTFCTMLPMRSIPFKVICVLGINDGDYPRQAQRCGFDLMEREHRLCDRSKRLEDRYLFLEILLSAREKLILSYLGQSIKDNTPMPPSPVVAELLDYIDIHYRFSDGKAPRRRVLVPQPLQPFSRRCFSKNADVPGYSAENFRALTAVQQQGSGHGAFAPEPVPTGADSSGEQVTIKQLLSFFSNPAAFFVRTRLNARMDLDEQSPFEDSEPFALEGLERYGLGQDLLERCLSGHSIEQIAPVVKAAGILPHGSPGDTEFRRMVHEITHFADLVKTMTAGGRPAPQEADAVCDRVGVQVYGELEQLYERGQVFFRYATVTEKDRLQAWMHHLLQCAALSPAVETVCVGKDRIVTFDPLAPDDAVRALEALCELYLHGLSAPLPFFLKTSHAYARAFRKSKDHSEASRAAHKKWTEGYRRTPESENIYIRTCFGKSIPDGELFHRAALTVFEPLFEGIKSDKPTPKTRPEVEIG